MRSTVRAGSRTAAPCCSRATVATRSPTSRRTRRQRRPRTACIRTNTHLRLHTYFAQQPEVSFHDGIPSSWDFIGDPLFAESALFYFPVITDPVVSGTMYSGLNHVWRTTDFGGPEAYLTQHCNEFTGDGPDVNPHPTSNAVCGDWVPLDGASLTSATRGDRSGGNVAWLARTKSD